MISKIGAGFVGEMCTLTTTGEEKKMINVIFEHPWAALGILSAVAFLYWVFWEFRHPAVGCNYCGYQLAKDVNVCPICGSIASQKDKED